MDLTQLANLGEFIGGVAVLVTLVYLATQVRQGNRLARAQVQQDNARMAMDFGMASDLEATELFIRARTDYDSLSNAEKVLAGTRFAARVNYYETLFYARLRGDVDDDLWESRLARMKSIIGSGGEQLWEGRKIFFGKRFRAFVDDELIPASVIDPVPIPGERS